jgi:hypothetical protein
MARRNKSADKAGTPADEALMARAYREAARELPPPTLDARILAQARAGVAPTTSRAAFTRRWALPVSVAALIMLSLTVVMQLSQRSAVEFDETPPAIVSAPAAPEPALREAATPAERKSTPAKPATPPEAAPTRAAPSAAVADANREVDQLSESSAQRAKKSAEQAPASAPLATGLMSRKAERAAGATADVVSVEVRGAAGAYEFSVGIRSDDRGCQQYADWWEVVSDDGRLLYRRVMEHSHVGEQPFVRAGGPVAIGADTVLWIRAHLNNAGYDGAALRGSVRGGFSRAEPAENFAAALAQLPPQPPRCAP